MPRPEDIDWNLYRSFLAVLRQGSLSGAARQLGTTQPSVGRHIDALERALGQALFTRSQLGLHPTAAAVALRDAAQAMESAAHQALRTARGGAQDEGGVVRLTASQIMGGEVLPALLADYRREHPRVAVELVLNNEQDDLLRREADVAVRMVRPTQKNLIAKRLGRVDVGLFAHQRYVQAHGLPRSVPELARHTLIGPDRDPSTAALLQRHGWVLERDWLALRTDSDLAQIAALRAGLGIGGCHLGIARRDPDLLPVLAQELTFSLDMWLVTHSGLRANRVVMGLFRFLNERLGEYARLSQR